MKIGTIVNVHLNRERLDVLLSVVVPFILMAESGYANGWVYAGGDLTLSSANTYLSLIRGFALEVLIYVMFKLVRILMVKKQWFMMVIPLVIGLVTMNVSAGLNLGWANRSGEMASTVAMVGVFLPGFMLDIFKTGIGLIFPIAVGAFALLDVGHLISELIDASGRMKERSLNVERAEVHQNLMKNAQEKSILALKPQYEQMAQADAQNMLNRVKAGDYSFGLQEASKSPAPTSVTRITPALPQSSQQALPAPSINSPAFPAGPPMGNTQPINFPLPPQFPKQNPGPLSGLNNAINWPN